MVILSRKASGHVVEFQAQLENTTGRAKLSSGEDNLLRPFLTTSWLQDLCVTMGLAQRSTWRCRVEDIMGAISNLVSLFVATAATHVFSLSGTLLIILHSGVN